MAASKISRRGVIAGSAFAFSAIPADARTFTGEMPWSPNLADAPTVVSPGPYQFFKPDEAVFIEAAVERLIPRDEVGPGALELGVPTFIDRQLAGEYGGAASWYMLGPWRSGTSSQGYQTRLTPAQLYRQAIGAIAKHLAQTETKKQFRELTTDQQDQVLAGLERDTIKLPNVDGRAFFELLLQNTIEGYFSDPIHGGNRDMAAWKMIGFPGARYDWRDYVSRHGERITLPPVSVVGRVGWNTKS